MAPQPRSFAGHNPRGLLALIGRDLRRHLRFGVESLAGPLISSLLFLAVFGLAGGRASPVEGMALGTFLAPGLIAFSIAHAAYQSAAFSMMEDKIEGPIADLLAAPLSALELMLGYVVAATVNGLSVGCAILLAMLIVVDGLTPVSALAALAGAIGAAFLFALVGLFGGLWARRWEHYGAFETFIILPLIFLSGAFFSVSALSTAAVWIVEANPLFHAVNALRYGLTGYADADLALGYQILTPWVLILAIVNWRLIVAGWRLRS